MLWVVDTPNKEAPSLPVKYTHIKGRADGLQVAVRTALPIENATQYTHAGMQELLNSWIDEENLAASIDEVTGELILQSYIDLGSICKWAKRND